VTPRRRIPEPEDGVDSANRRTIGSYDRIARQYGAAAFSGEGLRRLVEAVPAGGTALEVGSGPGWDADFVESQGVAVRRTDVAAAFIDFQAERGKQVDELDVTRDELGGPYDAVMALAVLQHVDRAQIPVLLRRVAEALVPGGVFLVAIREGDGERWEVGDSGNPYFIVLWDESAFRDLLAEAGLGVEWSSRGEDSEESRWLMLLARKEPARGRPTS
jgi:SAM-dependent methyltransferase